MDSSALWARLKQEVGDDELLLIVILRDLPDSRMDAELEPHMDHFRRCRNTALRTHGEQRKEWDEIRVRVGQINLFGQQIAHAEHRQVERLIKLAREDAAKEPA